MLHACGPCFGLVLSVLGMWLGSPVCRSRIMPCAAPYFGPCLGFGLIVFIILTATIIIIKRGGWCDRRGLGSGPLLQRSFWTTPCMLCGGGRRARLGAGENPKVGSRRSPQPAQFCALPPCLSAARRLRGANGGLAPVSCTLTPHNPGKARRASASRASVVSF